MRNIRVVPITIAVCEVQFFFCSRHCNVEQALFFLCFSRLQRSKRGKFTVVKVEQNDNVVFASLGLMNGDNGNFLRIVEKKTELIARFCRIF